MEFLFEILFELILEGGVAASQSKKVPKAVRGFLIVLISALFLSVIGLILFIGVTCWITNKIAGSFIITIGLVLFFMAAVKFSKIYLGKTK
ncbi:MAG: hypothetical protein SPJ81_10545 [Lachnoclostridium sp.]|nr:hypothetical protein [Lachnoclostridium sp.]